MDLPPEWQCPSLEEFEGWYNIEAERDDGYPVLKSTFDVPEFSYAEWLDLYQDAVEWFSQVAPPAREADFDPLAEDEFIPRSDTDDRTLCIDAVDFDRLSLRMLKRIQDEFLGRYPFWRVALVADDPASSIVVYPAAIRFGNLPVKVNPLEGLAKVTTRAIALREQRQRPARAFLARLRRLARDAVQKIQGRPFFVCGILDRREGDAGRMAVCILISGADEHLVYVDAPPGQDRDMVWVGREYGLDEAGNMISTITVPATASYCLTTWLVPADYRGPLAIIEQATGKQHTFEIRSEDILRTGPEEGGSPRGQFA